MALILPLVVLALMWVFLILPQQRRVRAHRAFVAGLGVGDEVVTTSGIHGTIVDLEDQTACLSIAPGVEITIARMAIGQPQDDAEQEPAESGQADSGQPASEPDDPTES